MSVDLNKYFIEIMMSDIDKTPTLIKVPITDNSLKHALLNKLKLSKEDLKYENHNLKSMSVLEIIKVNHVKIEKPTNVYDLNLYLNILKEKNINFAQEEITISNDFLRDEIHFLLEVTNEKKEYTELKKLFEQQKISKEKPQEQKEESEEKPKEKPIFTIKQLTEKHNERKGKNGK